VEPEDLKLSFVMDFYLKKKDFMLPLLILGEKIVAASFGQNLEEMFTKIGYIHPKTINYGSFIQIIKKKNIKDPHLTFLLKKLKKLEPYGNDLSQPGIAFVQSINRCGLYLENIFDLFKDLTELSVIACRTSIRGTITTSTISDLGKPFIKKLNPSIAEVLDLIEEFRKGQYIINGQQPAPHYEIIQQRWDSWILNHPSVWKYLDPAVTLVQSTATPPIPNLGGVINTLPAFPSGIQPTQVVDPTHGGNWEGMYECNDNLDAFHLAICLRSHFQHPPAGPAVPCPVLGVPPGGVIIGGGHGALRIVTFNLTPGGARFW
jgi:hypothetical protein